MDALLAHLGGVAALAVIGHLTLPALLSAAAKQPAPPNEVDPDVWARVTKGADGGSWVGFLERTLFFIAFVHGIETIVVAWLAFKLASKWEVWKNVIRLPDPPDGVTRMKFFAWTHDYGSWLLQRFWIGVLTNVLLSFVAAMGTRYLYHATR